MFFTQYNIQTIEMMLQQEQIDLNHKRAYKYQYQPPQAKKDTKIALKTQKHTQQIEELKRLKQKKLKNEDQYSDSSSQVSLEEDLLEQHLSVINKKIEIYYNRPKLHNLRHTISNSTPPKKQQTLKLDSLENYIVKLAQSWHPQSPILIQNFLSYLKRKTKFRNYMRHIYYSFAAKISQELVQLILKVWIMYFPYSIMSLSQNEIQKLAVLIHKKICQKAELLSKQSLPLSETQQKHASSKRRLYFIFTMTTLFVIQNIFKNPFYIDSQKEIQEPEDEAQAEHYERRAKLVKTQECF